LKRIEAICIALAAVLAWCAWYAEGKVDDLRSTREQSYRKEIAKTHEEAKAAHNLADSLDAEQKPRSLTATQRGFLIE
jgi:hypothetical protein